MEDRGTTPAGMDLQEIMKLLPHRYPFLLLDEVSECVPGHYICGSKNIARNEPCLSRATGIAGSSLPHLLIVEALAQLSVILAYRTLGLQPSDQDLVFFAGIDEGRFQGAPSPGTKLLLRSEVSRIRKMMGWFRARADVNGTSVVDVVMVAAIKVP